jgi:DNA primase
MMMQLDVEGVLEELGVTVLRETGDELLGKCPMHLARTGKEDRHPSWSINTSTYLHHCFSCGYSGSLTSLYRDLVGEPPEELEWELSKQSVRASLDKSVPVEAPVVERDDLDTLEWMYSTYAPVPDRLLARRMVTRDAADFYGVRWDKEQKCWVFPVSDPDGRLMGFQYKAKGFFRNYPAGLEKARTLFGLFEMKAFSRITVVESPLDAIRLYGLGIPTLATMGAGVSAEQIKLLTLNYRHVIAAMDNDDAGARANSYLANTLRRAGCVVMVFNYSGLDAGDPGDVKSNKALQDAWHRTVTLNL